MKTGYNNLTEEELIEVDDALDPFAFEKYCGTCIYFQTDECVFYDTVNQLTEWKKIKCNKFYD